MIARVDEVLPVAGRVSCFFTVETTVVVGEDAGVVGDDDSVLGVGVELSSGSGAGAGGGVDDAPEVITRLLVPLLATATNVPAP